jgi:hypothetical protein
MTTVMHEHKCPRRGIELAALAALSVLLDRQARDPA